MTKSDARSGSLKILHLATDAYGGYGGIALYNRDAIEALCMDAGVESVISVARSQPFALQPMPEKLTFDLSGLGSVANYIKAVWRQVRANPDIDLVYCSQINLAPVAWAVAKLRGIPWTLCIYGIDAWPANATPRRRFFASRADQIISLSQVTLDRFLEWCPVDPARCVIMPNAIHLEQFGVAPKNPELLARYGLEGKKVIMTFGRLDPRERYKGFDEIIELMPEMLRERPEIAYLIAGSGEDRDRLTAKAEQLGVAGSVVFTGMIDEAEKADTYRLADVYAMPGRGEGFGFVVLEAMACGVPAIGSDKDGTREAVREGLIGQVVDPDDLPAIKQAILSVIDQPKATPEGLSYFAFPEFARRLNAAIRSLVAR